MSRIGCSILSVKDEKVTITGQNNYSATYELPEEGEFAGCYPISNVNVFNPPSTGGPGDYLFTIIGIAISSEVILLKLRDRKKEIGL